MQYRFRNYQLQILIQLRTSNTQGFPTIQKYFTIPARPELTEIRHLRVFVIHNGRTHSFEKLFRFNRHSFANPSTVILRFSYFWRAEPINYLREASRIRTVPRITFKFVPNCCRSSYLTCGHYYQDY